MEQIHRAIVKSGFTDALLYTADGPDQFLNGALPELPAVINFGPGDAENAFRTLKQFRAQGPFMNGEYWAGWRSLGRQARLDGHGDRGQRTRLDACGRDTQSASTCFTAAQTLAG
jgi:hypothetical protein